MTRSKRIRIFETSIERLSRILSKRWKVKVVFKANECRTNGNTIYLPALPDNASDELLEAIHGHLDHETAHVVFTDFEAIKRLKRTDLKVFATTNALEDPRIERKFGEMWRGTAVNLRKSREWSLRKVATEKDLDPDPNDPNAPTRGRSYDQLSDFGKLALAASVYGQVNFDLDHWFLKEVIEKPILDRMLKADAIIRRAVFAENTKEVIDCAKEFLTCLNEPEEPVPYIDPEDIEEDAIFVPAGSTDPLTRTMFKPNQNRSGGPQIIEVEMSDGDEEEDNGKPKKSVKMPIGDQEEEDSQGTSPGASAGGADSDHGMASSGSGVTDPQSSQSGPGHQPDFTNVTDEQIAKDIERTNRSVMILDEAMRDFDGSDRYLVYTTEGDKIELIKDGDRVKYKSFMMEANSMVSVVKRKMSRSLLASNISSWEGDKTRGKLNPRALFRVPIGTSKRVFREKIESEDYDTVVQMMIDHSGSMSHSKLDLAAKTAIILGEMLYQLKIPFSVLGFSTGASDVADNRYFNASAEEQRLYSRWGNLWIGQYKDFDESWPNSSHRMINMVRNERVNTYDGESLRYGCQRLLERPEKRKIFFWLNDGCPCPNNADDEDAHLEYTKLAAAEVEKLVELVAIGIQTDAVKQFYKKYVVVNDLRDLPTVCLNEMDGFLRNGRDSSQRKFKKAV